MSLFPLPLTVCERVMLLDRDPRYPAQFTTELEMEGEVDRDLLERTLPLALERHPLLWARIPDGTHWVLPEDRRPPAITWVEGDPPALEASRRLFDPAREDGLRIWCQVQEASWVVILEVNHLCADGVGITCFLADWMLAYEAEVQGFEEPRWVECEPELLRTRGELRQREEVLTSSGDDSLLARIREAVDFLWWRPPLPSGGLPVPAGRPAHSEVRRRVLPPALTERLDRFAREQGGTLNDVLACQYLRALRRWWLGREPTRPPSWLQLMIPTNQRRMADACAPAANKLGWSFLGTGLEVVASREDLFEHVRRETRKIKEYELGTLIFEDLGTIDSIPGLLPLVLRVPLTLASAVLSNMGRIEAVYRTRIARGRRRFAGIDRQVLRVTSAPPLVRGAAVSVAVVSVAGSACLGAHFDRTVFDPGMQEAFMDLLVEELAAAAPA